MSFEIVYQKLFQFDTPEIRPSRGMVLLPLLDDSNHMFDIVWPTKRPSLKMDRIWPESKIRFIIEDVAKVPEASQGSP